MLWICPESCSEFLPKSRDLTLMMSFVSGGGNRIMLVFIIPDTNVFRKFKISANPIIDHTGYLCDCQTTKPCIP